MAGGWGHSRVKEGVGAGRGDATPPHPAWKAGAPQTDLPPPEDPLAAPTVRTDAVAVRRHDIALRDVRHDPKATRSITIAVPNRGPSPTSRAPPGRPRRPCETGIKMEV